jgi:hypothetical protein
MANVRITQRQIKLTLTDLVNLDKQFNGGTTRYINTSGDTIVFLNSGNTPLIIKTDGVSGLSDTRLRIRTAYGYGDIGAQNTSWFHLITDRPRFYFNVGITIDTGLVGSYDEDLQLQTSGTTRITIYNSTGNVAIGTTTSLERVNVGGNILIQSGNSLYVGGRTNFGEGGFRFHYQGTGGYIDYKGTDGIYFRADNNVGSWAQMKIKASGGVDVYTDLNVSGAVYRGGYRLLRFRGVQTSLPSSAEEGDLVIVSGVAATNTYIYSGGYWVWIATTY